MALFSIKSDELDTMVVVSSNCIGCVRAAAISVSPESEHEIWRDSERSHIIIENYSTSHGDIVATRVPKK